MYSRQAFSWHKAKKISLKSLPGRFIKIRNYRGVYVSSEQIELSGVSGRDLSPVSKELLMDGPIELLY